MTGYCPQCSKGQGVDGGNGVVQEWSNPQPCVTDGMPKEMLHLVPHITMGKECGHTISVDSFTQFNN